MPSAGKYDDFFARHHPSVYRALVLAGAEPAVAEDMAQEAFARAYVRWRRVSAMDHPAAWEFAVAFNQHRRVAGRAGRSMASAGRGPRQDVAAVAAVGVTVRQALAGLPARQREAVVLRFYADLSLADVAAAMGCALGTVKSTLSAAMASLRIDLEDEELHHGR